MASSLHSWSLPSLQGCWLHTVEGQSSNTHGEQTGRGGRELWARELLQSFLVMDRADSVLKCCYSHTQTLLPKTLPNRRCLASNSSCWALSFLPWGGRKEIADWTQSGLVAGTGSSPKDLTVTILLSAGSGEQQKHSQGQCSEVCELLCFLQGSHGNRTLLSHGAQAALLPSASSVLLGSAEEDGCSCLLGHWSVLGRGVKTFLIEECLPRVEV